MRQTGRLMAGTPLPKIVIGGVREKFTKSHLPFPIALLISMLLLAGACKTSEDAPDPVEITFYIAVTDHMNGTVYKTVEVKGLTNSSISVNYEQLAGGISGLEPNYFVVLDGSPRAARLGLAVNNSAAVGVRTNENSRLVAYVLESGAPYNDRVGLGDEVGVPQGKTGKRVNFDGQTPDNKYEQEVFQNVFGQVNGALSGRGFDTGYRIVGSIGGGDGFVYGCADCYGAAGWHAAYQGYDKTILFNTKYGLTPTGMVNVTLAEAVERFAMCDNPGNVSLGTAGLITLPAVKLVRAKALFAPK